MLHSVKNAEPPRPSDYLPDSYMTDIRPFLNAYIPPAVTYRLSNSGGMYF